MVELNNASINRNDTKKLRLPHCETSSVSFCLNYSVLTFYFTAIFAVCFSPAELVAVTM